MVYELFKAVFKAYLWLWSSKDVKNDMWVVKGKFCQNFPKPMSLFFTLQTFKLDYFSWRLNLRIRATNI